MRLWLVIAWLLVSDTAAAHKPNGARPAATDKWSDESCDDQEPSTLVTAIERELDVLRADPDATRVQHGRLKLSNLAYVEKLLLPIKHAAQKGKRALCRLLHKKLELRKVATGNAHVTAYYHPVLRGSRTAQGPFQVPLYRRPSDEKLVTEPTAAILDGALQGQGLEILYVETLAQALHIHIEGSATIAFEDGSEVNLTTDGHNGHPYQNPLRLLLKDKRIPDDFQPPPSQSRTQAYVTAHPEVLREYWGKNPHFVFFKETLLRGTGKFGELVAGRSIAIDPKHVPMGALLLLKTQVATQNDDGTKQGTKTARLVLAQDTGAAITGPLRVDLFVGSGEAARVAAGHTNFPGELLLVLPPRPRHSRRSH